MGGGSKPTKPKKPPKPIPPLETEDPRLQAAKDAELAKHAKRRGRASTLLSGANENVAQRAVRRRRTTGGQ